MFSNSSFISVNFIRASELVLSLHLNVRGHQESTLLARDPSPFDNSLPHVLPLNNYPLKVLCVPENFREFVCIITHLPCSLHLFIFLLCVAYLSTLKVSLIYNVTRVHFAPINSKCSSITHKPKWQQSSSQTPLRPGSIVSICCSQPAVVSYRRWTSVIAP